MRPTTLKRLHPNEAFVETGTSEGSGVRLALDTGFNHIYSIEIDENLQNINRERFKCYPIVNLITGDSSIELAKLIPKLHYQTTFLLDAHYERRGPVGAKECPLYEELLAILTSPIRTHTIMIDDMRMIGRKWGKNIVKDGLIDLIKRINNDYIISFEDNTMANDDVLVAHF